MVVNVRNFLNATKLKPFAVVEWAKFLTQQYKTAIIGFVISY